MKTIILILFLFSMIFADTKKIFFYTTENNINNFKALKVSFDTYLRNYGDYEFQPFNDIKTFEEYIHNKDSFVILSSWHYKKIAAEYNLEAKLVAEKEKTKTDTKILVGKKNLSLNGVVTSAYDDEYTKELLLTLTKNKSDDLSVLIVPKEIDALMSVSFGMSKFALVSRDSLRLLKNINPFLTKNLKIYNESIPAYRMLVTCNKIDKDKLKLMSIFEKMDLNDNGKNILGMIGVDKLVILNSNDLKNLGDAK